MKGYVQVYRNLNKKLGSDTRGKPWPVYSVRGDDGLIKGHTCHLMLEDCSLRVSEKGKERVRDEKRKNVHAYIQGRKLFACNMAVFYDRSIPLTYNPYKNDSFINEETGEPVHKADVVIFGCGKSAREVRAIL